MKGVRLAVSIVYACLLFMFALCVQFAAENPWPLNILFAVIGLFVLCVLLELTFWLTAFFVLNRKCR